MAGTSEGTPKEEELPKEPTKEDTSGQKTELDSAKEALAESQAKEKRYREQVAGSQTEAERLKKENEELKSQIPEKPPLELSPEDKEQRDYFIRMGLVPKEEVAKMVQEKVAPFQAQLSAREKSLQKRTLDRFKEKHNLTEAEDPDGFKLQRVISKLKRVAPADPLNPNLSLKEDLELAHKWAFDEETNKEALSKATAKGRAEGHEASETKVGEGASVTAAPSKKHYTSEQEAIMKEWGVDDETLTKKQEKK